MIKNMFAFAMKAVAVGATPPAEIQVCPLGAHRDGEGRPFMLTESDVGIIVKNSLMGENMRPLDYEHQTLKGVEAPASGWITKLINKGTGGLWAKVEWTKRAAAYILGREYRFVSPVLLASKKPDAQGNHHPVYLHSVSLTNDPAIDGMVPLVNNKSVPNFLIPKEDSMNEKLLAALGLKAEATQEQVMTAVAALISKAAISAKIITAIGIKEDATEDETVTAVTALVNKAEVPEVILTALGLKKGATASESEATILAMKQSVDAAPKDGDTVEKLRADLNGMKAKEVVTLAMKAGKVTAEQEPWALEYSTRDLKGFEIFVAKAPVVVPMGDVKILANKSGTDAHADNGISGAFGNSEEDLKKYGGAKS